MPLSEPRARFPRWRREHGAAAVADVAARGIPVMLENSIVSGGSGRNVVVVVVVGAVVVDVVAPSVEVVVGAVVLVVVVLVPAIRGHDRSTEARPRPVR
jgi:hypothetical protein